MDDRPLQPGRENGDTAGVDTLATAQGLCWRAVKEFEAGRYEVAADLLREALRLRPRLQDAHFLLGACYQRLGCLEEAAREAELELAAHPDHALALCLLGEVHFSLGRTEQARVALERAGQLDPNDLRARFQLTHGAEISVPTTPPARWPSISVCMIVRDEEKTLERCLRALGDLATQVVVVDTGSTDRTVEIARSLGAEVHHFRWIDDFAAARNESLRHARGEWIFWLDADDELSPTAVAQLKNAAASGLADAYTCRVVSRLPSGVEDAVPHTRLVRNGLGVRFRGRIHESLHQDLEERGLKVLDTDIIIVHTGYASDPTTLRRKHERNLAYLRQELAEHPNNPALLCYAGMAKIGLGDREGGEADLRRMLAMPPIDVRFNCFRFWAWTALAHLRIDRGEDDAAREALNRGLGEFPGHPYLLALKAEVAIRAGEFTEALALLRAAYERQAALTWGYRPNRKILALQVAAGYALLGNEAEERAWFARAGEVGLREADGYLRWVDLLGPQGRIEEALKVLAAAERHWPHHSRIDKGYALTYHKAGRGAEAWRAWQRALADGLPYEEAASHLALLAQEGYGAKAEADRTQTLWIAGMQAMQSGRWPEAMSHFADLVELQPEDARPYRYLAVALQKMGRTQEAEAIWRLGQQVATPGRA